jgi:hypothetical protein
LKKSNLHSLYWFILFAVSVSNGYPVRENYPTRSENSPKFSLDVSCFMGSHGYTQLELYYSVPSSELTFKNNSDSNNIASISILLTATNSDNKVVLNKAINRKLRVYSVEETKDKN